MNILKRNWLVLVKVLPVFIVLVSLVLVVQVALLITTCEKTEAAAAPAAAPAAVDNPRRAALQRQELEALRAEVARLREALDRLTDSNSGLKIGGTKVINSEGVWIGSPTGLVGPQGTQGPQGAAGTNLIQWDYIERGPRSGDSHCNYWGGSKWKCITTAIGTQGCWNTLENGTRVGCIILP
ncbi:MAG: hypothetical protein HQK53_16300 [Oligoflexia bacterium]|nr:hypothetical protein [Oligoflexia bacterium]